MFEKLPQECIFLILDFIIQGKDDEEKVRFNNGLPYRKHWKKKLTHQQIKKCDSVTSIWKPPPFLSVLPLTLLSNEMKNIFDTNGVWNYLYEKEFRKGVPLKRKHKNAKMIVYEKTKQEIKKRYQPIVEYKEKSIKRYQEALKMHLHQIHTIDTCLSKITPQIKDRNRIDTHIDHVGVILKTSVILPEGYINPWGYSQNYPMRVDLQAVVRYLNSHKTIGDKMINKIRNSKNIVKNMNSTLTKL